MSRSLKKGPYVQNSLQKKLSKLNQLKAKEVIKTWARSSTVTPDMVGHTLAIHNGKDHIPTFITENMVGHKLGEFAPTRKFYGHGGKKAAQEKKEAAQARARQEAAAMQQS